MNDYTVKVSSDGVGMIVSNNVKRENVKSEAWAALRIRCLADNKGLKIIIAHEHNGWYSVQTVSGLTLFNKVVNKKTLFKRVDKAIKKLDSTITGKV